MKFTRTVQSPVDTDLLYAAHRDDLAEWGPAMPEVRKIERTGFESDGAVRVLRHHWWGATTALPRLLRPWVPAEALGWTDEQRWDDATQTCHWNIHIPALGKGAVVRGQHSYRAERGATVVELAGEFRFVAAESPLHIPAFVVPVVERFVASMMASVLERSIHTLAAHARAA